MPIGTDSLLLACWANTLGVKHLLEVGSGCGVISLIINKLNPTLSQIIGIDIDADSVEEAKKNVFQNELEGIEFVLSSFQNWTGTVNPDMIISNPPFFKNSLTNPLSTKANARHQLQLTLDELIQTSYHMLNNEGRLALILPSDQEKSLIECLTKYGFSISRMAKFRPFENKPSNRMLLEVIKTNQAVSPEYSIITHYYPDGKWHDTFKQVIGRIQEIPKGY